MLVAVILLAGAVAGLAGPPLIRLLLADPPLPVNTEFASPTQSPSATVTAPTATPTLRVMSTATPIRPATATAAGARPNWQPRGRWLAGPGAAHLRQKRAINPLP